jgi:cyclohexanecarboxyl-CoA dehydrogenase
MTREALLDGLDDVQVALRDVVRRFGLSEVVPVRRDLEADVEVQRQMRRRLGDLGLLAIGETAEPSSMGVTLGSVCEEVGRYDIGLATIIGAAPNRLARLLTLADSELAASLHDQFAAGEISVESGFTEPDAGSDLRNLRTSARPVGGGILLNGEKSTVTGLPTCDYLTVLARERGRDGTDLGFSTFLVPTDSAGLSRSYLSDLGWRSRGRGSVALSDVFVPEACRMGPPGRAMESTMGSFDLNRATLALVCIGAASASVDETIAATRDRIVFQRPLASNQAVSFAMAEAVTELSAARHLAMCALRLRDNGLDHRREAAMAKWYATDVAIAATRACLRFNGHIAYSNELAHEQRLRDLIGVEIAEGSSEVMKLIIARRLFGRDVTG